MQLHATGGKAGAHGRGEAEVSRLRPSDGEVSGHVRDPLRASPVHTQGADHAAERLAGVGTYVRGYVFHAVPTASGDIGVGGEMPSQRRESSGHSLPRQRSPNGSVLKHCGLPPLPQQHLPFHLESGGE